MTGWENAWLGYALLIAAGVWALGAVVTLEPVRQRIPRVKSATAPIVEQGGDASPLRAAFTILERPRPLTPRSDLLVPMEIGKEKSFILRVGIANRQRPDIHNATINLLLPEFVPGFWPCDENGLPDRAASGKVMTTSEGLVPGSPEIASFYWAETGKVLPGRIATLLHFGVRVASARPTPIKLKIISADLEEPFVSEVVLIPYIASLDAGDVSGPREILVRLSELLERGQGLRSEVDPFAPAITVIYAGQLADEEWAPSVKAFLQDKVPEFHAHFWRDTRERAFGGYEGVAAFLDKRLQELDYIHERLDRRDA